jgi:hypothetical protein
MRMRWVVTAVYGYSALHILCWRVFLTSSQTEPWFPVFSAFFSWLFLPLNVVAGGLCWLVWGSLNIFEARYIVGPVVDAAAASLTAASLFVGLALWLGRVRRWRRLRRAPALR